MRFPTDVYCKCNNASETWQDRKQLPKIFNVDVMNESNVSVCMCFALSVHSLYEAIIVCDCIFATREKRNRLELCNLDWLSDNDDTIHDFITHAYVCVSESAGSLNSRGPNSVFYNHNNMKKI